MKHLSITKIEEELDELIELSNEPLIIKELSMEERLEIQNNNMHEHN